ncbi:LysE family transporter [Geoglobus acetivorans]|uniref:Lysine transporter LysE n=1 Tax=Geoglobus acetivorans TaxID=565033 RepID=A0A0A7GE12_GEOAI|nr:hypothetical protein GACE_0144 [Geoglobus acetivorans]
MDFITFILTAVFISLSGVLAPGPMLALTLTEGRMNRLAGIEISAGHAIVELPIIAGLFMAGKSFEMGIFREILALSGGILMLYLAFRELKDKNSEIRIKGILSGIAVSALNPYFIIWWLTIGFTLILISMNFGPAGIVAFAIAHVACDFGWYGGVALFANRISGMKNINRILSIISASILAVFGLYFIVSSIRALHLYFR